MQLTAGVDPATAPRQVSKVDAGRLARLCILVLATTSVTVRPVVKGLSLPDALVNIDAMLAPIAAGLVALAALMSWRRLGTPERVLTVAVIALVLELVLSWVLADVHSFASLGLGTAMLLLLPFGIYLVAFAAQSEPTPLEYVTLVALVLVQLVVGLVQYVLLEVAQKAPIGADLVNGTTSHNFWPVFALPASLALVLSGRDAWRWLWPLTVTVLAVYSEAKAALAIWAPLLTVMLASVLWARRDAIRAHVSGLWRTRTLLLITSIAAILIGLWWTPSVQSTVSVFLGHSQQLSDFAVDAGDNKVTAPSLRDASDLVESELRASSVRLAFGLGPGNSTSHVAEVMAQGAQSGLSLPAPGPVAQQLLAEEDAIRFRDAQSTGLGLVGDLGLLGVSLYLFTCACGLVRVARLVRSGLPSSRQRRWTISCVVGGVLLGGLLLDWPEQSSIVLPLLLVLLVLVRGQDAENTG